MGIYQVMDLSVLPRAMLFYFKIIESQVQILMLCYVIHSGVGIILRRGDHWQHLMHAVSIQRAGIRLNSRVLPCILLFPPVYYYSSFTSLYYRANFCFENTQSLQSK